MTTWSTTLTGGTSANTHRLDLTITQNSQNIANNTSSVTFTLGLKHVSGSPGSFAGSLNSWNSNFNGTADSDSNMGYDFRANLYGTQILDQWTTTITHNADGTKSVTASGSFSAGGGNIGSASTGTKTLVLTTIPRATTPTITGGTALTLNGPTTQTNAYTINLPRASTSFTHDMTYTFGALTGQTAGLSPATGATTSATFTPPIGLMAQFPSTATGSGVLTVVTKNGATVIGTKTLAFTATGDSTTGPTWSSITLAEATTTPNVNTLIGKFVKGVSKLTGTINSPAGIQGATITAKQFTVGPETVPFIPVSDASETMTGYVNTSGTGLNFPFAITDSRGKVQTGNVTADVLNYALPTLSGVTVQRATSGGVADSNGTYIRVALTAGATSLLNAAVQKNRLTVKAYTSPKGANTWTLRATAVNASTTLTYNTPFYFDQSGSAFDVSLAYDVRVEVSDVLSSAPFPATKVDATVSSAAIFQHWGAGLGLGTYWARGMLDVNGDIYGNANLTLDGATSTITADRLRLTSTADASATSTSHAFQIGSTSSVNLTIDHDEVFARNNGAPSTLSLNPFGGNVYLGDVNGEVQIPGRIAAAHGPWAVASGQIAIGAVSAGAGGSIGVTFPAGRFTVTPRVLVSAGASTRLNVGVVSATTSGFSFRVDNFTTGVAGASTGDWVAIQMTSSAASG